MPDGTDDIAEVLGLETTEPDAGEPGEKGVADGENSLTSSNEAPNTDDKGTDGDEPSGDESAQKGKVPETVPVKRLAKETYHRREAERDAAYWKGVAEGRVTPAQQPGQTQAVQPQEAAPEDPEPKEEGHPGTYDDYQKAHIAWQVRQGVRDFQAKEAVKAEQAKAVTTRQEAQDVERARLDDFMPKALELFPDLVEIAGRPEVVLPLTTMSIILDAAETPDVAAHIVKYLGMKPEESQRLDRLSEGRRALEISKLGGKIAAALSKTKTTNAPPPVTPVGGAAPHNVPLAKLSMEEFAKKRDAEERKRRG